MGGNNINKEVPILRLVDLSRPNMANKGTIRTSAPAPMTPAANPETIPMIVNPTK